MLESKAHGTSESVQMSISSSFQSRGNVLKFLNDVMGDPTNAIAETIIYATASFVTIEVCISYLDSTCPYH